MSEDVFINSTNLSEFVEDAMEWANDIFHEDCIWPNSDAWYNDRGDGFFYEMGLDAAVTNMFTEKQAWDNPEEFSEDEKYLLRATECLRKGQWADAIYWIRAKNRERGNFLDLYEHYKHIEPPVNSGDFDGHEEAREFIADFRDRIIPEMKKAEKAFDESKDRKDKKLWQ